VTSKPDFKVMVLLLVFMQLTRDLFAIAKFLFREYHSRVWFLENTSSRLLAPYALYACIDSGL